MAEVRIFIMSYSLWIILVFGIELVNGQGEAACYGAGSIATSVILTVILTALIIAALCYLWKKCRKRKELILETDPEKGKGEYAFDNPGFKDPGLTPIAKVLEKNKIETNVNRPKGTNWSPLTVLTKSEKKKILDDSAIDGNEVKVVELRSHDFTGLGFNICGNMKEGIYIKDVLHRGPASESGKLRAGDRINSVTISFEHMVYEDALTILSYASPYEVIIEAHSSKKSRHGYGQGAQPSHPVYRSSSCTDIFQANLIKKNLFGGDDYSGSLSSNYSSLQKSRSNMTTLERKGSASPTPNKNISKKGDHLKMSTEQSKLRLEEKMASESKYKQGKTDSEVQKCENKFQQFGVRVLPTQERSPKGAELSQNDNNINIEKQPIGIDEVDEKKPQVRKRDKKPEPVGREKKEKAFVRESDVYGSGIKRDVNGIPQEIPNLIMNAAVAARSNRKTVEGRNHTEEVEVDKTPKKIKGKAPAPPEEKNKDTEKTNTVNNLDKIQSISDELEDSNEDKIDKESADEEMNFELRSKNNIKEYNSDSDIETDNQSSVNTIELNSSDITIHHAEDNGDRQANRRTASTGDLTKIQKTVSTAGTLERAQSLDITDANIPTLTNKRKGGRIENDMMESDEDIFGKVMMSKEPRLSFILDGLSTFQRNRLKKSTEWGNLEDAILKLNQEDELNNVDMHSSLNEVKFGFADTSHEFDALVNKINEIKRESVELATMMDKEDCTIKQDKKAKNQIWPFTSEILTETSLNRSGIPSKTKMDLNVDEVPITSADKRQRKPPVPETLRSDTILDDVPCKEIRSKPALFEKKDLFVSPIMKNIPNIVSEYPNKEINNMFQNINIENKSDENKTKSRSSEKEPVNYLAFVDLSKNFIFAEKIACSELEDDYRYIIKSTDTNISDDIKISKHSLGSLERAKSDDAKISNITINNLNTGEGNIHHNLDMNITHSSNLHNEDNSELYTTALDKTMKSENNFGDPSQVTISTPDIIKNVTITEAINTLNNDSVIHGPSSFTLEVPQDVEITGSENKLSLGVKGSNSNIHECSNSIIVKDTNDSDTMNQNSSSLTYITEIQVLTPNSNGSKRTTNVSEIEIIPRTNDNNDRNLDSKFENYIRNFESNARSFEPNIQNFEKTVDSPPSADVVRSESIDAEKELHKIQEIAEEQLKKLPEMRFTTSSYESSKPPEKIQSQIELLRSNFEKSPTKTQKAETTPPKSRIPIATTVKTPPVSPERRDSRNLEMEHDKAILELMSATVHSTPVVHSKYTTKPNKNVTVTSIRNNSKIASGLPVLTNSGRPPIPQKKIENENHGMQVSTNGNAESSFKQWVFNPSEHSVTNIVVLDSKPQKQ